MLKKWVVTATDKVCLSGRTHSDSFERYFFVSAKTRKSARKAVEATLYGKMEIIKVETEAEYEK